MINDEADEVIKEILDSLKKKYQNNLNQSKLVILSLILFIYSIIS